MKFISLLILSILHSLASKDRMYEAVTESENLKKKMFYILFISTHYIKN